MTDKERLVEILEKAGSMRQYPGTMARILIENGVTFGKDTNVLTKADRIRAMSDVELVKFIEDTQIAGCPDPARSCRVSCNICLMDWLQQPAEVDND